ncbi:MAG: DUF4342 domain-containing protein [Tissierellaceae bacterium]|jgi:hypothetical protein|nr:DUF4342 domain-containing protein [Tissierellaceae bacterium]
MEITLEKIDAVVERTGVSFKEAKEALELKDGNVIEAVIYLESNKKTIGEDVASKGEQILDRIKEVLKKGNVIKIIVRKDGNVIMNIPVTAGAVGTILSPPLAILGVSVALLSKCTFEIIKEDGEIVNINEEVEKKVDKVKDNLKNN